MFILKNRSCFNKSPLFHEWLAVCNKTIVRIWCSELFPGQLNPFLFFIFSYFLCQIDQLHVLLSKSKVRTSLLFLWTQSSPEHRVTKTMLLGYIKFYCFFNWIFIQLLRDITGCIILSSIIFVQSILSEAYSLSKLWTSFRNSSLSSLYCKVPKKLTI